ncbi:hypothetical protein [Actinoplanes sp. HUAS TT8]|uniref:hypothetical protein n=1 Tax=Actinoplanes sp. HUAS TT8 TaxID=3447453 RepID=UPI003F520C7B
MSNRWYTWLNPFTNAKRVFNPASAGLERTVVQDLADLRAGVGLICIGYLSIPKAAVANVAVERLVNTYLSFYASLLLVAVFVGIYRWTHPDMSAEQRRAANQVWIRLLVVLAVFAAYYPIYESNNGDLPDNPILLILGLWLGLYSFPMGWYALRSTFGIGDVHPQLAPAVTVAVAFVAFVIDVANIKMFKVDEVLPDNLQMPAKLAALITVCLLAAVESYQISRRKDELAARGTRGPRGQQSPIPRRQQPFSKTAATGIVLSLICPPIGILAAGYAVIAIDSRRERGQGAAIAALVFAVGVTYGVLKGLGGS